MRTVRSSRITDEVARLCVEANINLPSDIEQSIVNARQREDGKLADNILGSIIDNIDIAKRRNLPICQDTGMVFVFVELGREVSLDGDIYEAINEGVRRGYDYGYLRKSVVADPLRRTNTGDNTPAIVDIKLTDGDKVKLTLLPKGFGSENMSRLAMLTPSAGESGVKDFVVETVSLAGGNPCPPIVVGVGIGGSFERVAQLAKRALLEDVTQHNPDPYYADMERELLKRINDLGIGPQGFGGRTTALSVRIVTHPTHIASLPVAVNISCHVTRHAETVI